MANRLLNVRLTPEDERNVTQLRARGVSISDLMRRALRTEALKAGDVPVDAVKLVQDIVSSFPTPAKARRPKVNATDRNAVRMHIRKRLRANT